MAGSNLAIRADMEIVQLPIQTGIATVAPALRLAPMEPAKKTRRSRLVSLNPVYSDAFKAFWAKYPGPRKNDPDVCWKLWQEKGLDALATDIMAAMDWQVKTEKWLGGYATEPARYLRNHSWKSEPPQAAVQAKLSVVGNAAPQAHEQFKKGMQKL